MPARGFLPRLRPALAAGLMACGLAAGWTSGPAVATEPETMAPPRLTLQAGSPTVFSFGATAGDAAMDGLRLGIDSGADALPLSAGVMATTRAPAAPPPTLGTRLTLGQPLGVEALGGSVDWRAAATVRDTPDAGQAYGLSLSIGSMNAATGGGAPSDLRIGLSYGNQPEVGEQGILLDFSYSF